VCVVHYAGNACNLAELKTVSSGLPLVEDAAQAIGAMHHGKPACSLGFAGCLSFYPTKNLGAFGDAGAICTNDDDFAERCRKLRVHGSGHTYHHEMIGGMFRLAAIQAAVLNVKLKYLNEWHDARRRNAAIYNKVFSGSKVIAPTIDPGNHSVYNQYVVRVPDRDRVKQALTDRSVATAIYYPIPLHQQECFAYLGHKAGEFPESERACREVLALPVYPELSAEQVKYVATSLLEIVG
jgi:dTDP-4-amino-4,6-dideoxygalactose transaminase